MGVGVGGFVMGKADGGHGNGGMGKGEKGEGIGRPAWVGGGGCGFADCGLLDRIELE